ncbi:MAG: ArsR/SmtB family transcription factor [Longimicrobiales bacterium]
MIRTTSPVFGQLAALADPTRSRVLLLLEQQPLTVSELCDVLQLPQSTVSRHLKVLAEEGWVSVRAEGASRVYRLSRLEPAARKLWQAVRQEISEIATSRQDALRLGAVRAERRTRSAAFFAAAAGQWDAVRREMFGVGAEVMPLLSLLDSGSVVGDLGCGTGQVAAKLAPFVAEVIGVDASPEMIESAKQRAARYANVSIRQGQLEDLPVETGELDIALLMLVLHYIVDPARVLGEAARGLRPGGRLLVTDMVPHDRAEYQETMGHIWQGFSAEQLDAWLGASGFTVERRVELPPDPQAKGPNLFAAVARRL